MVSDREGALWTLDELTARVALALSVDYDGQTSGRVREVPDGRVVRYYTTLGLVDRPVAYDGRIALYSYRHLLQIVAIKRLQQRGQPLAAIQHAFLTIDEVALERLAAMPAEAEYVRSRSQEKSVTPGATPEAPARRESFWNATPADAVTDAVVTTGSSISRQKSKSKQKDTATEGKEANPPLDGTLTGVSLSADAVLLAGFTRTLEPEDLAAIRAAAGPLLEELERRGLL